MKKFRLDYEGYGVPDHTKEAFENYFFKGFEPGSFLTSVLKNDLIGACTRCDHINREHIVNITKWMLHNAPTGSWGNHAAVEAWLFDKDNCRSKWADMKEKAIMWAVLQEQA